MRPHLLQGRPIRRLRGGRRWLVSLRRCRRRCPSHSTHRRPRKWRRLSPLRRPWRANLCLHREFATTSPATHCRRPFPTGRVVPVALRLRICRVGRFVTIWRAILCRCSRWPRRLCRRLRLVSTDTLRRRRLRVVGATVRENIRRLSTRLGHQRPRSRSCPQVWKRR